MNRWQQQFATVVIAEGPLTASEAAERCKELWSGVSETYRKRAKELVDMGLIDTCGCRQCRITNKLAKTYGNHNTKHPASSAGQAIAR